MTPGSHRARTIGEWTQTQDRSDIDILDGNFYVSDPYSTYAWLRDNDPVHWDSTNQLWCISRYDDIVEIERNKDLWISSGKTQGGYRPNIPADDSLIGLDDPVHNKRRNLVSRRFTPRAVSAWQGEVREKVVALIEPVVANGGGDIVRDLAAPLPAMMIGKLLGFPDEDWPKLRDWSERTIALGGGPRYFNEDGMNAAIEFGMTSAALYEEKKGCPVDDVMSVWTRSQIDGQPLTPEEVGSDCLLILDGGAETTRTVIARTLMDLDRRPAQWQALQATADFTTATEEFIRFVTPIHNMCRTASRDTELHGKIDSRRATSGADVLVGQPRPRAFHRSRGPRRDAPSQQSPVLRLRHALLPRRGPGSTRDPHVLRRVGQARRRRSASCPTAWSRCPTPSSSACARQQSR